MNSERIVARAGATTRGGETRLSLSTHLVGETTRPVLVGSKPRAADVTKQLQGDGVNEVIAGGAAWGPLLDVVRLTGCGSSSGRGRLSTMRRA